MPSFDRVIFKTGILWAVITLLAADAVAAGIPENGGKKAREFTESPAMKYDAGNQEADFYRLFRESEIVFTGYIEKIAEIHVPMINTPVVETRIEFRQIEVLKGIRPGKNDFRYVHPLEDIGIPKGMKCLVALKKAGSGEMNYEISVLTAASQANLSLVEF